MTRRLRGDARHGPGAGNAEDYSWRFTRTLAGSSELKEALTTEATTRTQSRHGSGHKGEDRLGCLEIKLYCWNNCLYLSMYQIKYATRIYGQTHVFQIATILSPAMLSTDLRSTLPPLG
jgi:hypothetical protein